MIWTDDEIARLRMLRDLQKLSWTATAAALPGRTPNACFQAYHKVGAKAARALAKAAVRRLASKPQPLRMAQFRPLRDVRPECAPLAPSLQPTGMVVSTSRLIADAELLNRVAERGLTAGVFGDPPPGRSALDQKRAREGSS